jgi:hypothetical protein
MFIDKEKPDTGDLVDTVTVTGRFDLTDAQRAALEQLLPASKRSGRPSLWSRRQLIDGIRRQFRRWQRVLTALPALADAAGRITWDVSVDSTICRAHRHAARAHKRGDLQTEPPGGVAGDYQRAPVESPEVNRSRKLLTPEEGRRNFG